MEKQSKYVFAFKKIGKSLFSRNLFLKIISIVFAMLIWGYVLTAENPLRTKTLANVSVSFTGEADLAARNLAVRGNREEILRPIEAKVSTALTNFADLSANDVTLTIDLKNVNKAGKYRLPITPSVRDGKVESLDPEFIEVEVDDLVSKRIPVETEVTGNLPEGYWSGVPVLNPQIIEIRGAKTDVGSVVKAVCKIDLTGRTESFNDAVNVSLLNELKEEVDSRFAVGSIPSVTIKLPVLPKKTVPFDIEKAIFGADNLPADYEIAGYITNPGELTVVGQKHILDTIESVGLESIDVSGSSESILDNVAIMFPEGVQSANGESRVEVYIDIREKRQEKIFESVEVEIVNLGKRLDASLKTERLDVKLNGRISVIREIEKGDISLFADVSGCGPGTYVLPLQIRINGRELPEDLVCTLPEQFAEVTITR
ncbi:MAG: YbbR-like protein [Firmicutes bacterium ADurb.Bin182]|nr:MAG: YbbR-like protein [Firmicutes bacterium ADurb.Bin182]